MNPRPRLLDDVRAAFEVVLDAEPADLVAAECGEQAIALRLRGGDRRERPRPARQPAARPARASPPAATRRRSHERRQAWIAPGNSGRDVYGLRLCASDVSDERRIGTSLRLLLE